MKRAPKLDTSAPFPASDRLRVRLDVVIKLPRAANTLQLPDGTDVENSADGLRRCAEAWIDLFALGVLKSGRSIRIIADGTAGIRLDVDRREPRRTKR